MANMNEADFKGAVSADMIGSSKPDFSPEAVSPSQAHFELQKQLHPERQGNISPVRLMGARLMRAIESFRRPTKTEIASAAAGAGTAAGLALSPTFAAENPGIVQDASGTNVETPEQALAKMGVVETSSVQVRADGSVVFQSDQPEVTQVEGNNPDQEVPPTDVAAEPQQPADGDASTVSEAPVEVAGVQAANPEATTTDAAEKTVTPLDLLRQQAPDVIGDLDRDNITIDNFGTIHRINTSNFVAISQAAKNHGKKLRVDFYDSLDKTPYKDAPKARGGYIPGHSMYSGETSDRRSVELTGQSLPTFYHFTEQLPDGTMKLTLALGDRFADLYTTPEQYHEAEQGIALQVAIVIEHGIVNDPTSLIGKPFSTDTRVVIGGGQAEKSAIKLFPAIVSDGNGLPISTDSSLTTP